MIYFGYILIAMIVIAFLRYPRYGVYMAILTKPTVDMFWWSKAHGHVSPLFIAGVLVPVLAIAGLKQIGFKPIRQQEDKALLTFLAVLTILTIVKLITLPQYTHNTIDLFSRFLSVMLFYFIGKYYFRRESERSLLTKVILLSFLLPFALTIGQQAAGINLTHFSDVSIELGGTFGTGEYSAFYLGGRHDLNRISGVYEGVYELAFMGAFTILIQIALWDSRVFRFRLWHTALFLSGAYLLYFTYSRSAWSTTLAAVLLYFMIGRKFKMILAVLAGVFVLYVTVENVQYRFEDELSFLLGESDISRVGYGRGNKWLVLLDGFFLQDLIYQFFGNYGIGNPENQFLSMMFWYGYSGLAALLAFFVYFSLRLIKAIAIVRRDRAYSTYVGVMMACFCIVCYWLGGLGNFFAIQISTQWLLWTWTGIMLAHAHYIRQSRQAHRYQHLGLRLKRSSYVSPCGR